MSAAIPLRHRTERCVPGSKTGREYVQAEVFQVVEIDPAFFSLCLSVRISKIFCQLHQSCNIRFHTSQSIQPFPFRWHKPHIFHVRKLFLA